MVSSGAAVTVGGAGGWLQGGGLGPFDRGLGLGVDNVVEYQIVTADGELRTANNCTNSDLFWALTGGGAGNLGVVLYAIHKAHPQQPIVRANILWMGSTSLGTQMAQAKSLLVSM